MKKQFAPLVSALSAISRRGTLRQLVAGAGAGGLIMVFNRLVTLASAILLARMLGVSGYGIYGFAIATAGILSVVVEFGLVTLAVREVARAASRKNLARIRSFTTRSVHIILVATLTVGAVTVLSIQQLPLGLSDGEKAALMLVAPLIGLTALVRLGAGTLMGLRRLVASQIVGEALLPLSLLIGVGLLYLFASDMASPQFALFLQILGAFLTILICVFLLRGVFRYPASNNPESYHSMTVAAWPFLLIGSAMLINQQIGTIVIGTLLGTDEVGLFRVASQGAAFSTFGVLVITKIAAPYFAQLHETNEQAALKKLFFGTRWLGFASCLAALAIFAVAGEWLIEVTFGPDFIGAAPILVILTLGFAGNSFFGPVGTLLSMAGLEKYSARALWAVAIFTIAGSIWVAPHFGVTGVALVMASATTLHHFVLGLLVRRHLKI